MSIKVTKPSVAINLAEPLVGGFGQRVIPVGFHPGNQAARSGERPSGLASASRISMAVR